MSVMARPALRQGGVVPSVQNTVPAVPKVKLIIALLVNAAETVILVLPMVEIRRNVKSAQPMAASSTRK